MLPQRVRFRLHVLMTDFIILLSIPVFFVVCFIAASGYDPSRQALILNGLPFAMLFSAAHCWWCWNAWHHYLSRTWVVRTLLWKLIYPVVVCATLEVLALVIFPRLGLTDGEAQSWLAASTWVSTFLVWGIRELWAPQETPVQDTRISGAPRTTFREAVRKLTQRKG